jgi:hypothetical protein
MKNKINLLGISGRAGSGKDLVGSIIQYLIYKNNNPKYEIEFCIWDEYGVQEDTGWEIKKFAIPLKKIVCILTGCKMEQLEDQDFKKKELGPEWWIYKLHDGSVYRVVSKSEYRTSPKQDKFIYKPTYRNFLETIGTDLLRDGLHPNCHVIASFADYVQKTRQFGEFVSGGPMMTKLYPNWIFTDVRFPNEVKAIKDRGGIVLRVNRFSEEQKIALLKVRAGRLNNSLALALKDEHPSETALDDYKFDYTIDNNGTIEELIEKVKELLIKLNII